MQRTLDPGRIEAFAHRSIPRLRLPDRTSVFLKRAQRLRALAQQGLGQVDRRVPTPDGRAGRA
jgi:hypothetical protein